METVYILQIVTICITAITLIANILITFVTNKQDNYNKIITKSRLEFMARNRDNAAKFISETRFIALMIKSGNKTVDLKPFYLAFEQINLALKPYNNIDKKILDAGKTVISLVEQSLLDFKLNETIFAAIENFSQLVNIYDDADWKFIKQQFNSTNKKSIDFDKICDEIQSKYL